jgi:hypothetical protein
MRKSRGMFEALERSDEWDRDTDLSMGASGLHRKHVCALLSDMFLSRFQGHRRQQGQSYRVSAPAFSCLVLAKVCQSQD